MRLFLTLIALLAIPYNGQADLAKEEKSSKETAAFFADESKRTPLIQPESSQSTSLAKKPIQLDLVQIFLSAPLIYGLLITLSICSVVISIYSLATFRLSRVIPSRFVNNLRFLLTSQRPQEAIDSCKADDTLIANMLQAGLEARNFGPAIALDMMNREGKRVSAPFWQKLSLLNDIVVIAPMLGLLGTVIGMFYAFYDINRSVESITALFDGLGIAVGTTVLGLLVSILSMMFYTTLKQRLVNLLSAVEKEALSLTNLITFPEKTPTHAKESESSLAMDTLNCVINSLEKEALTEQKELV